MAGAVTIALFGMVGTAFATPDNQVELIRGSGSDTTERMMQALDNAYVNATGCLVTAATQPLDFTCTGAGTLTTENADHDVPVSYFALGSGVGRNQLNGFGQVGVAKIDYARSSGAASAAQKTAGMRSVAYAKDAIPWVDFRGTTDAGTCAVDRSNVLFPEYDDSGPLNNIHGPGHDNQGTWPDGPDADSCPDATVASSVSNLTTAQVKAIFDGCTIKTWNQLDNTKPAVPIMVWNAQNGSGTRTTFDGTFLGGNSENCVNPINGTTSTQYHDGNLANGERKIFENNATPIVQCAVDPDGAGPQVVNCPDDAPSDGFAVHYTQSIYYYAFGPFQTSGTNPLGQGADLGGIDGVQPSPSTIGDDSYTFSRFVYNMDRHGYTTDNAPDWVRDYIGETGWICKSNGLHGTNPKTGVNFGTEIGNIISAQGFVPIADGPIGGGVGGNSKCRVS